MMRYFFIAFLLAFGPLAHIGLLLNNSSFTGILANTDLLFLLTFLGWAVSCLGLLLAGFEYELHTNNRQTNTQPFMSTDDMT